MNTEKDSRGLLHVSKVHSLRLPPLTIPQQLLGLLHADHTHPNIHTRKISTPPGTLHCLHHTDTFPPHAAHAPPLPEPGGGDGPVVCRASLAAVYFVPSSARTEQSFLQLQPELCGRQRSSKMNAGSDPVVIVSAARTAIGGCTRIVVSLWYQVPGTGNLSSADFGQP